VTPLAINKIEGTLSMNNNLCNHSITMSNLELDDTIKAIARSTHTPVLFLSRGVIKNNYLFFKSKFKTIDTHVYYPVKVNAHSEISSLLRDSGAGFEIASTQELKNLLALGVLPDKIIFGNTIRTSDDIAYLYSKGIRLFVADNLSEIEKVGMYAPGASVFIRLTTRVKDSHFTLGEKFGVMADELPEMIAGSQKFPIQLIGFSFHVGSQCYLIDAWQEQINQLMPFFQSEATANPSLNFLNIGGGFPIENADLKPDLLEIFENINQCLAEISFSPNGFRLIVEPGRALVGNAGIFAAKVIARHSRNGQDWLFLNAGIYNGLSEAFHRYKYIIKTDVEGISSRNIPYQIAGPSCDSLDFLYADYDLPPDIQDNDTLFFMNAGAYTLPLVCDFNGLPAPEVVLLP